MAWAWQLKLSVNQATNILIFFADLIFNATYVFLGFNIDVIFCFAIKLPFLGANNSFEVMIFFQIVPLKEKTDSSKLAKTLSRMRN